MASFVLDSYAVLALLTDDVGAAEVRELVADPDYQFRMSVVNLGEVHYVVGRTNGADQADEAVRAIFEQENITVEDVTWELARLAAMFKSRGGLSYADAFVCAEAARDGAAILTGDPEFESVPALTVHWLPRKGNRSGRSNPPAP
jgi:PIN domain nuclease of toxin-antitoxin system